ncbi:DNA cytosine methyltransferase [Cytobacillus purgationiresistens]|uniref:DNA (cytosine-5-)-methyltransferase n=1 Tax=Cytobacillus purgationiresistens TaxID=863449 RepID=A0ABU0ACB4_9BACI|nr:DNA cytosine methyltransferase [Cytobacillus purgationiresistens]MDQ0268899.1 DNA (cytosine-5)-methyltransferase 1 [Cytobacillus purgationiresistens]
MKQLDLFREIIVDNFAGGGGASTGIEMATGLSVDIAINHDPAAIAMHKLNHPDTEHYCESVWDVDPKLACRGRKVGLAWFSPDCTHHSKAKGGKPVKQEIRGLAWIAVKWALAVKPRVIMLENVEEFKDWGPLEHGKPIKELKGITFNSFVKCLEALGYEVQFRELQACDYGAPTIRKRFFMIARSDGRPIIWPEPTHGNPNSILVKRGKLEPWNPSGDIIDWSIGVPSIFGRKRPLVKNTLNRIERGMEKFVINAEDPYIVPEKHQAAFLISYYTEQSDKEVRGLSLHSPLHTITAGGNRFGLVTAFLTKYYGQGVGQSLKEPLHTITTKDRFGLVAIKSDGYAIKDIGLRMLQPHELFLGQGFPSNYIYNIGKKTDQIRRVGNSVPPPFAEALVRANLPEYCVEYSRYKPALAN